MGGASSGAYSKLKMQRTNVAQGIDVDEFAEAVVRKIEKKSNT